MRRQRLFGSAVVVAVAALSLQYTALVKLVAGRDATPVATTSAAVATGSSALTNLGARAGWKVMTSVTATQSGAQISTPGFATTGWLTVTNDDAGAPGTEINALLQNGACPNVFFSDRMKTCFGQMTRIGPQTIPQFAVPWWYRTDFPAPPAGRDATLVINGVVGKADVFVDGAEVATSAIVTGAYARRMFDITDRLVPGTNSIAIKVYPNDPTSMLTVDNVDWTQIPPDNNTGIQFPVQLRTGGPLVDDNAHVVPDTATDLSRSVLTVKTDLTNTTSTAHTGTVRATVTPPVGSPLTVTRTVTVPANATRAVTLPAITITRPRIWWPYQLGDQPLYRLATSVAQDGRVLNSTSSTFGIRTVSSSLVGASALAPDGVRAFRINNTPIVIRGGGFDPDLFLRYSATDTAHQIALMKALGINAIRLEGHLMPDDFYRQMDAAGILINAGYQCCDFWEDTHYTSADNATYRLSAQSVGQTLRNHPAVFSFQWSDNAPTDEQESLALQGFAAADYTGPFIASAEYKGSPRLGPAGEKEGPYDWVPPTYWYDTTHSTGDDLTNSGGAWGYDSEQSAGNTVPTLDSINRFLSPADQAALWQDPGANQYHNNYEGTQHTGYNFGTLFNLDAAISNRYGAWSGLRQYVQQAQVANYENTRAQFEAFIAHSTRTEAPSTGTIYWQLNKGWPTLLWALYNYDGDQAGSFFGAQEANRALHAIFTLDDHTVTLDNLGPVTRSGVTVEARVFTTEGALVDDRTSASLTLAPQQVRTGVLTPLVPSTPDTVHLVELLVRQHGTLVDRNVYWQPATPDVIDWDQTLGNPQASMTSYANLKALQSLPRATISATATTAHQSGPAGADRLTSVTITNTSTTPAVGFFLRADIRRATPSGTELPGDNELRSSIWDGNDVTLWPGESETITVRYRSADLDGATPVVSLSGWNVPRIDIVAR